MTSLPVVVCFTVEYVPSVYSVTVPCTKKSVPAWIAARATSWSVSLVSKFLNQ